MRSQFMTIALAAAVAAGSLSVPTTSLAQEGPRYSTWADYCHHQKKKGQRTGAVLGAIAGAVIGSNVAGHGNKTGGAVVGAAAGAAVGANVGREMGKAKCDDRGAYWSRDNTYDYGDRHYYREGGRHGDRWYQRRHCRWAQEYDGSYVRVCPDSRGYYRFEP
jgi:hypothetical protein